MKKKIFTIIVCICTALLASFSSPAAEGSFSDVSISTSFYREISWAAEHGIITGYKNGSFRPDGKCTRAAFVEFLWKMCGSPAVSSDGKVCGKASDYFADINEGTENSLGTAIAWAYTEEIAEGSLQKDGTSFFVPWEEITRGEAVTMLWRCLGKPDPGEGSMPFSDVNEEIALSSDLYKAILWAANNGVTTGYDDKAFKPNESLNRSAAVSFICRTLVNNGTESTYETFSEDSSFFDSAGNLEYTSEYRYDSRGNLLKDTTSCFDTSGKIKYSCEYRYDSNGNLLRDTYVLYDGKGSVKYKYEFVYEFDAYGNLLREIESHYENGANPTIRYEREYAFNTDGALIKETSLNFDSAGKLTEMLTETFETE